MKKLMLMLIAGMMMLGVSAAEFGKEWYTDFNAAKKAAAEADKPILLFFTGSDYCPLCMAMEKEIFSQQEFKTYAKDNLILTLVDFPKHKAMSAEQKMANRLLYKLYRCDGLPQTILVDADGKVLNKFKPGYNEGEAKLYMTMLKDAVKALK